MSTANRINQRHGRAGRPTRPMRFLRHRHPTCTVLENVQHGVKKLLPLQGEGWDGGGVSVADPIPTLTLPLKGRE